MFQDIVVSKSLIDQYRTYCENLRLDDICMNSINNLYLILYFVFFSHLVNFSVMVLSSNSWPFSAPPNFVLSLEVNIFIFLINNH